MLQSPDVPLPANWSNFLSLDENKIDLARFLIQILVVKGQKLPQEYELVTGGGFTTVTDAESTRRSNISLHANHEEEDTRMILHACDACVCGYKRIEVVCSDTDVV